MRQDELDLIQPLSSTPILNSRGPTVARIAQAVDKDDGSRMPGRSREDQGSHTLGGHGGGECKRGEG